MFFKRACCFCSQAIERSDDAAVEIVLSNLWHPKSVQGLHAHSTCVTAAFPDRAMVDPDCLID
ncbi:hypothetical protein KOAAANKH_02450 [Brevundimonas sp. NIBR10]|nr:hypothetical protein KOAAANKH_02450 [Brevundimonas sp. NIBR10]